MRRRVRYPVRTGSRILSFVPHAKELSVANLFVELDADWARYHPRREVQDFVGDLNAETGEQFDSADALVREIRSSGRRDPDRADEMLILLLRRRSSGPVAQRVVLQALLPGLCAVCRRLAPGENASMVDDLPAEVVSIAGLRIANLPARTPSRPSARQRAARCRAGLRPSTAPASE